MKPAALALVAVLLVAGASVAIALPPGGIASLLDLTGERLPPPPEVQLLSPQDADGVGAVVRVAGTASSAAREVIDVQVRLDGGRWLSVPLAARGHAGTPFEAEVHVGEGDHLLEVRAWDGEAFSLPARAQVRHGAPTLRIREPADGAAVPPNVRVSGTLLGAAQQVVVLVGGARHATTPGPGGVWSLDVPLAAGVHALRIHAEGARESLPQTIRVAVDGAALTLLTPRAGAAYGEAGDLACGGGCILFTGTSEGAARILATVDAREAVELEPDALGRWSYRLPMLGLANGTHVATFTPLDASLVPGVPRSLTLLARTPLALRIDGDGEPRPTGTPLRFAATGDDAATAHWTLDGVEVGRGAEARLELATPGEHVLVARTQPSGGTSASASLTLHALNRPPSVRLLPEPLAVGATATLVAEASDPDSDVVAYRWEFGDGLAASTSAPEATHRYFARGLHVVNVTAVDAYGATGRTSLPILIPEVAPLVDFRWEPADPTIHDVVTLRDLSRDPDGRIALRTWTFPDGSVATDSELSHRFRTAGPQPVTLAVLDDDGLVSIATKSVQVRNLAPIAGFDATPELAQADEDVLFTDLTTDPDGSIVSWRWELGDGATANTSAVLHRYASPGNYTVDLTVRDHLGALATFSRVVRILDSAPLVTAVVVDPPAPRAMENVTLEARGRDREGALIEWRWEFGDGTNGTGPRPVHAYPRSGLYHGRVTVLDEGGLSAELPFTVAVSNALPRAELRLAEGGYAAFPSVLVADAHDPGGRAALFRFDADGDGAADCEVTVPRCVFTYPTAGVYGARVWVEDDEAAIVEAALPVEMLAPPSHLAPPVVRIEWPPAGTTLRGDQLLRGEATGPRPIAKVELQMRQGAWSYSGARDAWRLLHGASPWSSLLDTRGFPDGSYDLVIRATDTAGGVGHATVPVQVLNGARANEISLTVLDTPETLLHDVDLRASAYHPQGVTSVRWRVDDGAWRFIGSSPLAFTIPLDVDRLKPGLHVVEIEAFRGTAERAATNVTFRIPGAAPALVVDDAPPPVAHGLLRATGRVVGVGHAQWRLDHGLWRDLPPGNWTLAEETMKLPGGPYQLHLRAISPDGLASDVRTYDVQVVNPGALQTYERATPTAFAPTPGPSLALWLGLLGATAALARRRG